MTYGDENAKVPEFREAEPSDLAAVMRIYAAAVRSMEAAGIYQWDDSYPSAETVGGDLARGELHIGLSGGDIASVFALNAFCDREYASGNWRYPDLGYRVIHRLCVNPAFWNRGVGRQTVGYAENLLRRRNCGAVRLDAFSLNPAALRLYEELGYEKAGEVRFRKGIFYLYEKKL